MNEQEKQDYLEKYKEAKKRGIPFFPDAIYKDAIISLVIFLLLVGLAFFLGAPLEERADPADTTYTPKPEWYFLFLFQLLKYFPGNLEVIGVIVIPTIAVLLLLVLPIIDRTSRRHFTARPLITVVTVAGVIGFLGLTVVALLEAPPPAEVAVGDPTAALYTENCAGCHGSRITVPASVNLHEVIAQGGHEGMPAWGGDLSGDEIDALAGFILSPSGSASFFENCSACHAGPDLIAGDPITLKNSLEQGLDFSEHAELDIPDWSQTIAVEERTALLNFLIAPDGQRLFTLNCASCHGRAVSFSGEEEELRNIITQGGLHLEMPPWRETLSENDLDLLATYIIDTSSTQTGETLFEQYCVTCHGDRVPSSKDFATAREIIASGGAHETMPIWGDALTSEQLDALVAYSLESSSGVPLQIGQQLFAENCAVCHGDFGEGGPNPARPDDIIAPISSAEYLSTRDDSTLRSITAQGQPNFGMSPFGTAFGGPLDDEEIDAIVAFLRSWEANPPVEFPPEVVTGPIAPSGAEVFAEVCARCHGAEGEGGIGPALKGPSFLAEYPDDEQVFDTISLGHDATAMIPWGEILTANQINELVIFIRQFESDDDETPTGEVSFQNAVVPILEAKCIVCHGSLGGWNGTSFNTVIDSGDHGPAVIPGDVENSLLAQKILGTHSQGDIMPPGGMLPEDEIQIFLDWISTGASDN
jgi:mono/diheme cytochrome c family protein